MKWHETKEKQWKKESIFGPSLRECSETRAREFYYHFISYLLLNVDCLFVIFVSWMLIKRSREKRSTFFKRRKEKKKQVKKKHNPSVPDWKIEWMKPKPTYISFCFFFCRLSLFVFIRSVERFRCRPLLMQQFIQQQKKTWCLLSVKSLKWVSFIELWCFYIERSNTLYYPVQILSLNSDNINKMYANEFYALNC